MWEGLGTLRGPEKRGKRIKMQVPLTTSGVFNHGGKRGNGVLGKNAGRRRRYPSLQSRRGSGVPSF